MIECHHVAQKRLVISRDERAGLPMPDNGPKRNSALRQIDGVAGPTTSIIDRDMNDQPDGVVAE